LLTEAGHLTTWSPAGFFCGTFFVQQADRRPEGESKTFYVYGPERLLMRKALETYCRLVRPEARVVPMPIRLMSLMRWLSRDARLQDIAQLMGYLEHYVETEDRTGTNTLLGAPTTTLQQWCQAQR
jgi:hypothetical protein